METYLTDARWLEARRNLRTMDDVAAHYGIRFEDLLDCIRADQGPRRILSEGKYYFTRADMHGWAYLMDDGADGGEISMDDYRAELEDAARKEYMLNCRV